MGVAEHPTTRNKIRNNVDVEANEYMTGPRIAMAEGPCMENEHLSTAATPSSYI